MRVVAVIPARYGSSRFCGKVLARQTGKFLVEHVYERVRAAGRVDEVLVATDDERVGRACESFGAGWRMTRADHPSGTDRVAEVVREVEAAIVVNVQADEPELEPGHVDRLVELLEEDERADMATLAARFGAGEEVTNPNVVKVVCDGAGHALYFSRWAIPYVRDEGGAGNGGRHRKHLGVYAYRRKALLRLSELRPTPLEQAEKLEQLRALENGMVIAVGEVEHPAEGIDTAEQYAEFVRRYKNVSLSRKA